MDTIVIKSFAVHLDNFRAKVAVLCSLEDTEIPPPNSTIAAIASAATRLSAATKKLQARHVTPHYTRLLDNCNKLRVAVVSLAEEYQRASSSDEKKAEIMNELLKECGAFEDNLRSMETEKLKRDLKRARLEASCPCKLGDRVERARAD